MPQCPSHEQLDQLLAGRLNDAEEDTVCTHVEACVHCQAKLDDMVRDAAAPKWSVLSGETPESDANRGFLNRLKNIAPPVAWSDTAWNSPSLDSADRDGAHSRPPEPHVHRKPHLIRGYEILDELGRGGMGVVYKARQVGLNRFVALKMVLAGDHADLKQLGRFRAEAEAIARLQHPNIVQIYEVGEQEGRPFLVLELVEGGSLDERLSATPQPPRAAAELVLALTKAVAYAHEHGVVHRDLKPANVLLQRVESRKLRVESQKDEQADCRPLSLNSQLSTLNPKITDFGLAKVLAEETGTNTQTGAILGTPSYMAPEQAEGRNQKIGPPCDIYSLGAILYEMLTGRPPFKAETPIETLQQVLGAEPVPPSQFRLRIPRDLETICLKCLEKESQRRYTSASDLADDLDRFLHDRPIQARRTGSAERAWRWCRRNKALAALAASIVVLLAASAIGASVAAALWRHQRDEAIDARNQIADAERQKTDKLWESLLAQAQASRRTDDAGRRFHSLQVIAQASRIRRDDRLRTEAIACLALVDLRQITDWQESNTMLGAGMDIDPALEVYAALDRDGDAIIRRTADNAIVARLTRPSDHSFWHLWPRFSPDGRLLVGNYLLNDGTEARGVVWSIEDRRILFDTPHALHWLPDGRLVGFPQSESALTFYRPGTDRELTHSAWTKPAGCVATVSPSGRWTAIWRSGGEGIKVVDAETGDLVADFAPTGGTRSCTWSPDERLFAVGGVDGRVYVWDMQTRHSQAVLEGHQSDVIELQFHPAGHLLASMSWDGTTRLWDPVTGRPLVRVTGLLVRFSSDGDRLGLQYGTQASVWQLTDGREYRTLAHGRIGNRTRDAKPGQISGVDFSTDGRLLATAGNDGVRVWEVATCREVTHLPIGETNAVLFDRRRAAVTHADHVPVSNEAHAVRMHQDVGDLFTYGRRGLLHWPVRHGETGDSSTICVGPPQILVAGVPGETWFTASLQAGGSLLALNRRVACQALLLRIDQPTQTMELQGDYQTLTTAVSPDGKWAAAAYAKASGIQLWNARTGERECLLRPADRPSESTSVAFSPDGQWIVSGGQDEYRFWRVGSWQSGPTVRRDHGEGWPYPPAFTPDGKLVALPLSAQRISLFDPAANREITTLTPPDPQHIQCLAFSPDGTRLAVTTNANTVQLWDLRAIRRQLAELDLDWDQRPYSVVDSFVADSPLLRVEVQLDAADYAERGTLSREDGNYAQAIADFRRSLELNPDQPVVCNSLAWALVAGPPELRAPDEALPLAEKAVAGFPNDRSIRNTLGVVYFRLGKYALAVEVLKSIASLSGDQQDVAYDWFFLAMSYHALGDTARSAESFFNAIRAQGMAKLSARDTEELNAIRTEAEAALGARSAIEP